MHWQFQKIKSEKKDLELIKSAHQECNGNEILEIGKKKHQKSEFRYTPGVHLQQVLEDVKNNFEAFFIVKRITYRVIRRRFRSYQENQKYFANG